MGSYELPEKTMILRPMMVKLTAGNSLNEWVSRIGIIALYQYNFLLMIQEETKFPSPLMGEGEVGWIYTDLFIA